MLSRNAIESRARSAATIRALRILDSTKRGNETREQSREANRPVRVTRVISDEIAQAILNVTVRKELIAEALRKDLLPLRVNDRASARGWSDLYARFDDDGVRLTRENPAKRNGLELALMGTRI